MIPPSPGPAGGPGRKDSAIALSIDWLQATGELGAVLVMDADRQHPPEAIPRFLAAAGVKVYDSQCGMRLPRGRALREVPPARGGYEAESEHLKRCLLAGVGVEWVPIPAIYDGQPSRFRALRDGARSGGRAMVVAMKALVLLAVIGGLALLARRFGPQMRARCLAACDRMIDEMPDSFPPKRIMSDLEALRTQSERMIALLEEQLRTSEQAPPA